MIKDALEQYAQSSNRTFSSDRSQTVGASDVGQCARKTFWVKNEGDPVHGAARDEGYVDTWGARVRGSVYENAFWEPALRAKYGDALRFAGADQKTFVSGFLSATPDGVLTRLPKDALAHLKVPDLGGDELAVECKTIDPRTKLDGPKPEHIFQTQVQMGLVRELTHLRPNFALLTYTDTSFWNEVAEFPVKFDPAVYEVAKARAAQIMTATSAADLKPEGWIAGGRECDYCPFTSACGRQRTQVPEDGGAADPQFAAEVADLARIVKDAEAEADDATARMRTAQEALKARLREKRLRKITAFGTSVNWSSVKGRQSWDNKKIREALEATGADMTPFSTIGEPTDRLTISVKVAETQAANAA